MPHDITPCGPAATDPLRTVTRPPAPAVEGHAGAVVATAATPNPTLRLDSGLGMVVIEFRSTSGEVVASLPTPREIAAYRVAALTHAPGPDDSPEEQPTAHRL
ncbi:hypothetical protein [Plastoroseomonas arctica]|uniref:Uncharacterized protein n=1 Tax=Plastoroseomonas arctica TaxID=1509237 RepID=A0AAF1K6G3_9PROT|nr:hypothetical protein [Plastoroseomonas arctica]MBR0657369.1 hypothetical protein [Plastoroseomonas arctica]